MISWKDLTLTLIPESLITGTVTLASSEPPDSIPLQIFRRQVQDGRAHWVQAGGTQSTADGQFRFADLPAGTYKLLTREQLDRDPVMNDPLAGDPLSNNSGRCLGIRRFTTSTRLISSLPPRFSWLPGRRRRLI